MDRRQFLGRSALLLGASALGNGKPAFAQSLKEFRIGYQKNGVLVIARQQQALEKRFAKGGIAIKWVEFSAGPPMMEAMNAGSVDFGQVGDSPPVFAQAAGANIVYVAGQPITNGQGILVKQDSEIRKLADLKGKRIALGKGTSAHNVTIMALENAGLQFGDITPVYLNPPEGAVGALRAAASTPGRSGTLTSASARLKGDGRVLAQAIELAQDQFVLYRQRRFRVGACRGPAETPSRRSRRSPTGPKANRDKVGKSLAEVTGVDSKSRPSPARRSSFAIGRIDDGIVRRSRPSPTVFTSSD